MVRAVLLDHREATAIRDRRRAEQAAILKALPPLDDDDDLPF
jgi:hypothetical protein